MENKTTTEEFKPYIPAEKKMPEFTLTAVIMGIILAIGFGMANAYLGLKVGMTVSASIPAAVISMGVLRGLLKRGTILENNMVQTIASAGVSLASGVIFTVPAFIIWANQGLAERPDYLKIVLMALIGGTLGVLFMIPLRRFLIVQEHKNLPFPEGTACAEVLIAGDQYMAEEKEKSEKKTGQAGFVFTGIAIGAVYQFLMKGLGLWKESPTWTIPGIRNAAVGIDVLPALLGVGFLIGLRTSALMLAGGVLGWLVFIPLISYIGAGLSAPLYPATKLISQMSYDEIWKYYLRYIGAGAVAFGGIISLCRAIPVIIKSFQLAVTEIFGGLLAKGSMEKSEKIRTENDFSMSTVVIGSVIMIILIAIFPKQIPAGWLGALMVAVFGFFFVTVSSRIVGIIGSSSNPASGMTIATLLGTTVIFKLAGWHEAAGMVAALSVGALVCIAICIAGDTSQDLKTGYLVGATPKAQQIGMIIGTLASAIFIGVTVFMLDKAVGIGSKDLSAPQATLISLIIEGVMKGSLPWALVFVGAFCAGVVELLGASSLPFAVGLYLPISLSVPVMSGGIIAWLIEKKMPAHLLKAKLDQGVLVASGLIAGDAIMGVVVAFMATAPKMKAFHESIAGKLGDTFMEMTALVLFLGLAYYLWWHSTVKSPEELQEQQK